jgi:hypothetical protein
MPFAVWWILFGVPLAAAVFAWVGLFSGWGTENHRFSKVSAILMATASAVWACGSLVYVQFVRPISDRNYIVECLGLLFSLAGVVSGLVALRFHRWFSTLALGVSAWMFVLFFVMGSTY